MRTRLLGSNVFAVVLLLFPMWAALLLACLLPCIAAQRTFLRGE